VKKFCAILAVGAAALALSACGSSSKSSSSLGSSSGSGGGGATTLRLSWQTGYTKPVGALIAAFEKAYPNVKVTPQFYPIASYGQAIQTQFQAGGGPDLVWGSPGKGNSNALGLLEAQGKLIDLSGQSYSSQVPKQTLLWDGSKLYGVPVGVFPIGGIYNVAALTASGLSLPTTFSQVLADCRAAASKGKIFNVLPGATPNLFGASLASDYVYNVDPNWTVQRNAHQVTFASSPLWRTMLERIVSMNKANCFGPGVAGLQIPQSIPLIASGKGLTGLLPGDAVAAISLALKNVQLKMFPWPGDTAASTRVPISFGQGLGINKATSHLKQAEEFIAFAMTPTGQAIIANGQGVPSLAQYQRGQLTPPTAGLTAYVKQNKTTPYAALSFPNPAVYNVLGTGITGLLTGQMSISQVLQNLDNAWNTGTGS
jgi:raffinose/stachyose/melibiose transport system substrate-binding protein